MATNDEKISAAINQLVGALGVVADCIGGSYGIRIRRALDGIQTFSVEAEKPEPTDTTDRSDS